MIYFSYKFDIKGRDIYGKQACGQKKTRNG